MWVRLSEYTLVLGVLLVLAVLFDVYAYYRFRYAEELAASIRERKAHRLKERRFERQARGAEAESDNEGSEGKGECELDEFEDAQCWREEAQEARAAQGANSGDAYFIGSTREDVGNALLEMSGRLEDLSERVDSLCRQLSEAIEAREAGRNAGGTGGARGRGLKYVAGEGFREFKDIGATATDEIPEISLKSEGSAFEETEAEGYAGSEIAGEDEPEDEEFGEPERERKAPRKRFSKTAKKRGK